MKAIILAVDPGDTTGWVRVDYDPERLNPVGVSRWGTFNSLADEIKILPGECSYASHVVCEDYVIYPDPDVLKANVGSDLTAVRVMGRLQFYATLCDPNEEGVVPGVVHFQTASKAKQWWPDSRLKNHFPTLTLYPTGRPRPNHPSLCRHECDALRHAMTFIEDHYGLTMVNVNEGTLI